MFTFSELLKAVSEIMPEANAEEIRYKLNAFIREANRKAPLYVFGDYLLPHGSFSGTFDSYADPGAKITLMSNDNGLSDGDTIVIYGSTNLDGEQTVANQETNSFDVTGVFSATETGYWYKKVAASYLDFPSDCNSIDSIYLDDTEIQLITFRDYITNIYASNLYAFIDYNERKVHFTADIAETDVVKYSGRKLFTEISDIDADTEIDLPDKYFESTWRYIVKELMLIGKHQYLELYPVFDKKFNDAWNSLLSESGKIYKLKIW